MSSVGTTKHFLETGGSEWFIPKKDGLRLNYPVITLYGNQFYVAHGVKANHFMTDSVFYTKEKNKEIIVKNINKIFKEVCK